MAVHNDTFHSTLGHGFIASVVNSAYRALASVSAWNDARVTRNVLNKLTDRELDDIGLTRGDIPFIH